MPCPYIEEQACLLKPPMANAFHLSDKGLFRREDPQPEDAVPLTCETEIFEVLGLPYVPLSLRGAI
jgi:hypothetical protein